MWLRKIEQVDDDKEILSFLKTCKLLRFDIFWQKILTRHTHRAIVALLLGPHTMINFDIKKGHKNQRKNRGSF